VHDEYYAALLRQLRTLPEIAAAGIVDNFSLGTGTTFSSINVAGKSGDTTMFMATPGYFEAIGARVTAGRLPQPADARGAVINEIAARTLSLRRRRRGP